MQRMKNIVVSLLVGIAVIVHTQAYAAQANISGPSGSGKFGSTVAVLPNGNIVIVDPDFDASASILDVGAVYLFRPDGVQISVIKGDKAGDRVGSFGVTVLSNGHFVISSPEWGNNGALKAGAVTFGNATGGNMTVSAQNSLVGTQADDQVGIAGVVALSNGHYVVNSFNWRNGNVAVGANTWATGNGATVGTLSAANSLIGSQAADFGRAVALSNGNYVVTSPNWDNGAAQNAGAVTWCSGASGCKGVLSAVNSLVGSQTDDEVGNSVTPLSNGNYVVGSSQWNNGDVPGVGAATWRSGTAGAGAVVSSANSMIGFQQFDNVSNGGITALSNGHYVIASPTWNNGQNGVAGAATWGNGVSGSIGVVSIANSLVGDKVSDFVGGGGVAALSNGHYVVASNLWNNGAVPDVGAATWGDGSTGTTGLVSTANSLTGSQTNDRVGSTLTALSNGNYVVASRNWKNGGITAAGAATWRSGIGPAPAVVTTGNSLVGNKAGDNVGEYVTALSNGTYVVTSPNWMNGAFAAAGAVSWGNGSTGTSGVVSTVNSVVGSSQNDQIGVFGVTATADGRFIVASPLWDRFAVADAGATTLLPNGLLSSGPIVSENSVLGTAAMGGVGINHSYDALRKQLVVGRPAQNIVSLLSLGQATSLSIVTHTPNPSEPGELVQIVFAVTAASAPQIGTVNVFLNSSATTCTDSTPEVVNATTSIFSCNITFANAGNYLIDAEFLGNTNGSHAYSRSQTGVAGLHTVSAIAPVLFANGFENGVN